MPEVTTIENTDLWLGALMSAIVFLWPMVVMRKFKWVTQIELIRISTKYGHAPTKYTNLNSAYLVHMILTFLLICSAILGLSSVLEQDYALHQRQAIVMARSTVPFSGFALSSGLFALRKGVYHPISKFYGRATHYLYAEGDRIQRIGRRQIIAALVVTSLAFLIGLVR